MRSRALVVSLTLVTAALACSRDLGLPQVPGAVGAITGRIVTRQALTGALEPAPQATLEFLRGGPRAEAGPDGYFAVRAPEAPWQLLIRDGCDESGAICTRQRLIGSADLPLDPDVDLSLGDVVVADNGEIRGRVTLGDRQAGFGGVVVYVPGAPFRTETGDDGTFVLQNVPEGTLTVGFFAAGYEPVTRSGVRVAPAASTQLALVELPATPPANVTASIRGRVTRADGNPGDVRVEARRQGDAAAAGMLDVRAGDEFLLEPLPLGLYAVVAEAEGYGRAVVPNLLLHQDVSLDLDVGTVVVPELFQNTGGSGGSGGTGGSGGSGGSGGEPVFTCADAPSLRGPCLVDWSPPTDGVLPAMGAVTLWVDEPLVAGSIKVIFRSSLGQEVAGVVSYLPPSFGAGAGGAGGDTGTALGRIQFSPSRPLSAGTWTPVLTALDGDGMPAIRSGPTWLVTGVEAGPAVAGSGRVDMPYAVWPPSLAASSSTSQFYAMQVQPSPAGSYDVYAEIGSDEVVPSPLQIFTLDSTISPAPRLVGDPQGSREPLVVNFGRRPCKSGFLAQVALMNLFGGTTFQLGATDCSEVFAVSHDLPLLVAGWQDARGSLALTSGDENGLVTAFGDTLEKGTSYRGLDVFDVQPAQGTLSLPRRLLAGVRLDPQQVAHIDVMEVEGAKLTPLPGEITGATSDIGSRVVGCSAAGFPVLLFTTYGSGRDQAFPAVAVHDGARWVTIAAPPGAGYWNPITCVSRGDTAIAFWSSSGLRAAYLVLDTGALERSRWIEIRDRRQASGALNLTDDSCYLGGADAILEPWGDGLLYAYTNGCFTPSASYGELRFGRLY